MYRTALRSASRPALRSLRVPQSASRRLASSSASPANKPRSWKGTALRWGLAAGALYYYNTSSVFAEEAAPQTVTAPPAFAESDLPTVDSVLEEKRRQIREKPAKPEPTPSSQEKKSESKESEPTPSPQEQNSESTEPATSSQTSQAQEVEGPVPSQGAEALEEEAGREGAFNPETGEINWDCPCLGGMAHGPCGEEFKTAFSCFVYSEADPKGMDCIEKFQGMQECFRQYPEIYGAELADEEEAAAQDSPDAPAAQTSNEPPVSEQQQTRDEQPAISVEGHESKLEADTAPEAIRVNQEAPKKWEDASAANDKVEDKKDETKAEKEA